MVSVVCMVVYAVSKCDMLSKVGAGQSIGVMPKSEFPTTWVEADSRYQSDWLQRKSS